MAEATLTLTDDPATGQVTMEVNFGDAFDEQSKAHSMLKILAESVLNSANNYQKLDDTVPDVDVEPSRIIKPEGV